MEYYGAADYFFWQGVERAQIHPNVDLQEILANIMPIETQTAMECRDAYMWGFWWGRSWTLFEYCDMMALSIEYEATNVNIVSSTDGSIKEIDSTYDVNKGFPVKGNC